MSCRAMAGVVAVLVRWAILKYEELFALQSLKSLGGWDQTSSASSFIV